MPAVVEIPQWQGSAAPTAQGLSDGARALAGLVPDATHIRPEIIERPGTTRGNVRHADILEANLTAIRKALAGIGDTFTVTVGGDCGVELAPIERARRAHGDRLAVVWFDAHGDLNTPGTSPGGGFHGMVLRTLLGEAPEGLGPHHDGTLDPGQVILAGARALDPGEIEYIERHRLRHLNVADLTDPANLTDAVAGTGAQAVYVHIDLDVLDPGEFASVGYPEPGGLTPAALTAAVRALAARFTIAGLGITEYHPTRPADQDLLAALVPGLIAALRHAPTA